MTFTLIFGPLASMAQEEAPPSTEAAIDALLDVLQDEAARTQLIERLTEAQEASGAEPQPEAVPSFAQGLASLTSSVAGRIRQETQRTWSALSNLDGLERAITLRGATVQEITALVLLICVTIGVYRILLLAVAPLIRGWQTDADARFSFRVWRVVQTTVLRVGIVVVAWLGGQVVGNALYGGTAATTSITLYLNAFAIFGIFRAVVRGYYSPEPESEASLSTLAPRAQEITYRNLRTVGGFVIQTVFFIVPLIQNWAGFVAARSARVVLITLALILAIRGIVVVSRALKRGRDHRLSATRGSDRSRVAHAAMISLVLTVWPWIAALYVLAAWGVALAQPRFFDDIIVSGTVFTLGGLVLAVAGQRIQEGLSHAEGVAPVALVQLLPSVGARAHRMLAITGWVVAIMLWVAAVAIALHGWNVIDLDEMLARPAVQLALWGVVSASLIALGAGVLWIVVSGWIDYSLDSTLTGKDITSRKRTLLALFRSAFTITLGTVTVMVVLSQLGINIGPLLAGAGVVGLAVGFGAQKFVQDIITGAFIQIENAINEGDVVSLGGVAGGVEKISIRSVRLRSLDGTVHIIPFSSVDVVSNLTRGFGMHVAEIGVAYKEDIKAVKQAMFDAYDIVAAEFPNDILEPLEMHGVTALGDSAVTVRARIKTRVAMQWGIGRRYTEIVKEIMDARGIEIPFPHRQLMLPPELRVAQRSLDPKDVEDAETV